MSPSDSMSSESRLTSASVLGRIEATLEGVADSLANSAQLEIRFSSRRQRSRSANREEAFVKFPGSSAVEARKFARVLLIMQLAHQAMTTGTVLTKRHIFYQHQELFETQRVVDELVDDLAYTLGTDRDDLNITASSKGSISGCITIHLHSGELVDASQGELGAAVPPGRSISRIEARDARWLLVVEKDAVFRSLITSRFWETSIAGRGILVTAKGYPDLVTRSFLAKIEAECPLLPMLVLSDFDPDGINIFSCYRYGTSNFSHESSNVKVNFGWLGIQSGHLGKPHSNNTAAVFISNAQRRVWSDDCLVDLTARDRLCAIRMLRKHCQETGADLVHVLLCRELQIMLMLGTKAEIQSLDEGGDITHWLDNALRTALEIIH